MLVLVLTDVEGSTRLWIDHPDVMADVMTRHHAIVHESVAQHGGWRPVDQGEGDAVFAAFDSASAAVAAVLDFQRALGEEAWPEGIRVRDRVGIHVGEVEVRDGNLFGVAVARTARIRSLGAGGQVLASAPVIDLFQDRPPGGATVTSLGEQRLKDLLRPERIFQVVGPGMDRDFPPLKSLDRGSTNLPMQTSSFVGRESEVADLTALFGQERLITITGFGGVGKTRLATQVAAELADGSGQGVWFVDFASVTDAGAVPMTLAAAVGVEDGGGEVLDALSSWLASRRVLLVLDNLEQLLPEVTDTVDFLLGAGPDVHILATCREPLRLAGEQVFALQPLPVPEWAQGWSDGDLDRLRSSPAVELFVSRARAGRRDFALTTANAQAVADICVRVDGLPLAIELVAARLRGMSVHALLSRLDRALPVLAGGSRSLPARHQTMRATIVWSTQSLPPGLQRLLHRLAVFAGPFTLDVAEAVLGDLDDGDAFVDVFDGLLELVDRSLVRLRPAGPEDGLDRYDLLVPIREYAWEQLTLQGDADRMRDRHADHYARLTHASGELTREERDRLFALVHADWPNLAAALTRLHEQGDAAAEVLIAPWIARGLQEAGRDAQALTLLRDAVEHLAPDDTSTTAGIVVLRLALTEFQAYRSAAAVETLRRARAIMAANPDPALVVLVAALNSRLGDPGGDDPALIERAGDLLASMSERGNAVPRWYLAEQWVYAVLAGELPTDARLEREQARLLDESSGADHAKQRINLATFHTRRQRYDEAETLMRVFSTTPCCRRPERRPSATRSSPWPSSI